MWPCPPRPLDGGWSRRCTCGRPAPLALLSPEGVVTGRESFGSFVCCAPRFKASLLEKMRLCQRYSSLSTPLSITSPPPPIPLK